MNLCQLFNFCSIISCLIVTVSSGKFSFGKLFNYYENFHEERYYNNSETVDLLRKIEKENPEIAKVHEIGKSVLGQSILALELTTNITQERSILKPMVKFVANIHGDEPVPLMMLLYLAQHLVYHYGYKKRVTDLLNSTDLFLVPTLNPDGYAASKEDNCESLKNDVGRNNANGVNLNTDFPGFDKKSLDNMNDRQPETKAMINWILNNPFVLSASFHSGGMLVSYPFDKNYRNTTHGEKTPDDALFRYLALKYALNSDVMFFGVACGNVKHYEHSVTNGAEHYEFEGGMQDFNYLYSNCFEITAKVDCCKYPFGGKLTLSWLAQRESMFQYIESVHMGVKGLIHDVNDNPISGALVNIVGIDHAVKSTNRGEFWRLLLPGNYTMLIEAPEFETLYENVTVSKEVPTIVSLTLKALN